MVAFWTIDGVVYRLLERSFDSEVLFQFNKTHGSTPLNFIPDGPVREHLGGIKDGTTLVWAAFVEGELAGFITGERGGGYFLKTGPGPAAVCFIHEFVISPNFRGRKIGTNLTQLSIDPKLGVFGIDPAIKEMYTTVHEDNVASRTAFIRGGYHEVLTYEDAMRKRNTTVLKFVLPSVPKPWCSLLTAR